MITTLLTVIGSLVASALFTLFALAGLVVEIHDRFPADANKQPLAERARAAVHAALTSRATVPAETPAASQGVAS